MIWGRERELEPSVSKNTIPNLHSLQEDKKENSLPTKSLQLIYIALLLFRMIDKMSLLCIDFQFKKFRLSLWRPYNKDKKSI